MIEQGFAVNARDEKGLLPLHVLVKRFGQHGEGGLDKDGDLEFVYKKLIKGVEPTYIAKKKGKGGEGAGDTLLHLCVKQGNIFLVKELLDSCPALSLSPSPTSSSPLSSSSSPLSPSSSNSSLSYSSSTAPYCLALEMKNGEGLTVWDCAVRLEREEVAKELVEEMLGRASVSFLSQNGPSILKSGDCFFFEKGIVGLAC